MSWEYKKKDEEKGKVGCKKMATMWLISFPNITWYYIVYVHAPFLRVHHIQGNICQQKQAKCTQGAHSDHCQPCQPNHPFFPKSAVDHVGKNISNSEIIWEHYCSITTDQEFQLPVTPSLQDGFQTSLTQTPLERFKKKKNSFRSYCQSYCNRIFRAGTQKPEDSKCSPSDSKFRLSPWAPSRNLLGDHSWASLRRQAGSLGILA